MPTASRRQESNRSTSCSLSSHSILQSSRQQPSESVEEYIDREEFVWERLRDALRALDKADSEEDVEPIHWQF
eukprot:8570372-Lingulodinium_polyedra.AAC.1